MKSNSQMEICIFVDAHVFDGEFQGTRTYLQEIYTRFLAENPQVTVLFAANNLENLGSVFGNYKNAKFAQYKSHGRGSRIFIEAPGIIKRNRCTHAHFQYIMPLKKDSGCKYIVTVHDILFNDFPGEFSLFYRLQRNLLFYLSSKRADCLLTVSDYSKERIAKQYNIDVKKIIVTPNGVGDIFFNFPFSKIESKGYIQDNYQLSKFILYVSRIEPRKNQTALLNIFIQERLFEQGYKLVFMGKNSLKSDLFETIEALSDEERKEVVWIEQAGFDALKHFYNAADLFVYPSKAEGFGIPPLEAAALGTVVASSNKTAMRDFTFFNPYMFDPDDRNDMKKKVLDALDLSSLDKQKQIKFIIKKKYTWEISSKILKEIIYEK